MYSYWVIGALCTLLFAVAGAYIFRNRKGIDCMHGMMVGMSMGILAGLVTATLFLIPTGNFLWGVIIGSIVGLAAGIPFGKLGGHLGVMEGIMAGPMGGMMGGMLGQMVRPFSIETFMPFFVAVVLLTLGGTIYVVDCSRQKKPSLGKISISIVTCVIALFVSTILSFSVEEKSQTIPVVSNELKLPSYLQQASVEERVVAVMKDGYQEIAVEITGSKYSPNVIVAKKGVPLRLKFHAQDTAGCAREVVFPSLNIDKIVPAGGNETVEINLEKEGVINFRCSMDMVHGRIEVQYH